MRAQRFVALAVVLGIVGLPAAALAQGPVATSADTVEADGTTALHWASYQDDHERATRLIEAGANVNAANDLGVTPLWAASENGSVVMVRRLLAAGADPNLTLLAGESPLMVAARSGSREVVEGLLSHGADVDARGPRGQTALMWAAAQHHADVVEALIAGGADLHARSDTWSQMMAVPPHGFPEHNREIPHGGNTALLFAARVGALDPARRLVAAGTDVDDADAWGVSATGLAAHAGHTALVEYLLDAGADPSAATAGFAPLHTAVMRRDDRMATALLAHGADPNARLEVWTPTRRSSRDFNFPPALIGATPFWLAARVSAPDLMRLLADHGADPRFVHGAEYTADYATRSGAAVEATTALMAAVGMGGGGRRFRAWVQAPRADREMLTLDAVRLAIELGVDINAADTDGATALDGAEALGFDTVVDFLLERGALLGTI